MNLKSNNCAFYSHLHGQLVFYLASQKLAACMSEFYNLQRVTEEAEVIFFGGFSADKLWCDTSTKSHKKDGIRCYWRSVGIICNFIRNNNLVPIDGVR